MESPIKNFKFARYRFFLKAKDPLYLPEYKGSALRGGFGYAFKKVVCALKNKECPDCLLKEKCIYSYVFETPPPADTRIMRKYPSAPHPFVLLPPLEDDRTYEPGEKLEFQLTLIGKAIDYLPYFIYTFEELGKMGLGKGRGKFSLEEVKRIGERTRVKGEGARSATGERCKEKGEGRESIYSGKEKILRQLPAPLSSDLSPLIYHPTPSLHLLFLTPTRLKFEGELTSDLKFHIFFRNLLRRISLLSYFHCEKELDVDYRGLIREAEGIATKKTNLCWYDWERYSTRQEEKMKLGGFLGRIEFSGDLRPFWPYVLLGEFIHVGKGSSFGLGKYEILNKC
jgi:hypothetical protein